MGTGYTRQSLAGMQDAQTIEAADHNTEFNLLEDAFDGNSGHSHDGTTGEGPKIDLTTSISQVLPVANGGIAAIHKIDATTAPTVNEDSGDGYGPGSVWINVTGDIAYICLDATVGAAVWDRISYNTSLDDIAGLNKTDGNIIVANGTNWVVESGDTARTTLGVGTGNSPQFASIQLGHASDTEIVRVSAGQVAIGGSGVVLDSDIGSTVQAYDSDLDVFSANPLTAAELVELQNIGSTTISAAQWGYLGSATTFGGSLLDDSDASAGRTTLGLGTISTQDANNVSITGGEITVGGSATRLVDDFDSTKKLIIDLDGLTTSTARTLTMTDANFNLADAVKRDGSVPMTNDLDLDSHNLLNVGQVNGTTGTFTGTISQDGIPAFSAVTNTAGSQGVGTIAFGAAITNNGLHYSTGTNRFTAPFAGRYAFSGSVFFQFTSASSGLGAWQFYKNGAGVGRFNHTMTVTSSNSFQSVSGTVVLYLNAGDYVTVNCTALSLCVVYQSSFSSFSGHLIG